jgi:hypothetical protein
MVCYIDSFLRIAIRIGSAHYADLILKNSESAFLAFPLIGPSLFIADVCRFLAFIPSSLEIVERENDYS